MNLGISKQLDRNLYSNTERAEQVRNLFTPEISDLAALHFEEYSTQLELEKIANFILYGKDPVSDKNSCQLKEVQIKSKYSAYQRKEPESLDALLEDPLTNETHFEEIKKTVYKKIKPTIDREKDKNIPGMKELWEIIDKLAEEVQALKDKGTLNYEYYRKNHLLIQLRTEQYVLKDSATEQIGCRTFAKATSEPSLTSDTGYLKDNYTDWLYKNWRADHYRAERGEKWYAQEQEELAKRIRSGELNEWEWVEVSENEVDLTNPEHVYQVLELYGTLKEGSYDRLNSDLKFLLWELEAYIEKAKLSKARFHILVRKIDKATNDKIREELQQNFGLCYSDNYISTIYKQMICAKIAKTAQLAKDEFMYRNQPEKFKICSTCGTKLLRDQRNFIKKQNSKDGLSARCKDCDKKIRDMKKGGNDGRL